MRKRRPKNRRRQDAMPQIISRIKWHDGMSRRGLDKTITKELVEIWYGTWSENELQQKAMIEQGKRDELLPEVLSKLDRIILRQAETLGWRLFISTRVLHRISMWEADGKGANLFLRLGKALAKSVRIVQRKELSPIDNPDLVLAKDRTIRELKSVMRKMKRVISARGNSPKAGELSESFVRIVLDSGEKFPNLKGNLLRWVWFLQENPTSLMAHTFGKRRPTPAALFYEWLSFCKGHDAETLRKMISSLHRLPRN
jgi:hypothetical protein